jgi:virginiamycin B lyase
MTHRSSILTLALLGALLLSAAPANGQDRLRVREVTIPPAVARGITIGPDDNVWFTGDSGAGFYGRADLPGGYIGRIDSDTLRLRTFPTPTAGSGPENIVSGPDGALWFTERNVGKIGRITTEGDITEFPLPNPASQPRGITRGPDGALWVTLSGSAQIARVTTGGQVTVFTPGLLPGGLVSIATGPDRALWFTEFNGDRIVRLTTAGGASAFPVSNAAGPEAIARSEDGSMYFTELDGDRVGRLTMEGEREEWPVRPSSNPSGITQGPDDAMWFVENEAARVGRVTSGGNVTEYELPRGRNYPFGIVAGANRRMWVTLGYARKVVAFTPPLAPVVDVSVPFNWSDTGSGYRFTRLRVADVPEDGTVRLTCRGAGCNVRFTREGVRQVDLRGRLPRNVRPGMRIEVRVSAPGLTTFVRRFTATSSEILDRDRCIAPSTTRQRSCPAD